MRIGFFVLFIVFVLGSGCTRLSCTKDDLPTGINETDATEVHWVIFNPCTWDWRWRNVLYRITPFGHF